MRTFDKAVVTVFFIFGLLAAVFGVGTIIHAYTTIKPGLVRIQESASETLHLAEKTVAVLDDHPEKLRRLDAPRDSLVGALSNVHFVVQQTADVSLQAADALEATAGSLKAIPDTSDLFLPEDKLAQTAGSLSKSADSLRHLNPRLEELQGSTRKLTDSTTIALEAASQLNDEWVEARVTLGHLVELLREARNALKRANLANGTAQQVSLQGGIYILLSVVLFGMAGMWRRLSTPD